MNDESKPAAVKRAEKNRQVGYVRGRTVYVNVFPGGHADWFDTEAEARAGLNARALKIAVPVTFEV